MGVSGQRFLELTKAKSLQISKHALRRLHERTGWRLSEEDPFELFLEARQVSAHEMIMLGYRPAYGAGSGRARNRGTSDCWWEVRKPWP